MRDFFKSKLNIFLVTVLFVASFSLYFVLTGESLDFFKSDVEAIDYSRLTVEEVEEWMTNEKLEDKYEIVFEYSEEIKENKFISQSIKPGEKIIDLIKITFSKGKDPDKEFQLPEVNKNLTREIIEKFFTDNGFSDVTYEYQASELPKDNIIGFNLEGLVKRSDFIVVYVSLGQSNQDVEVINLVNQSLSYAQSWAKENGINLKLVDELSNTVKRDYIISQSISAGNKVKQGTTITISVSNGVPIEILDIKNKKKEDVQKWANDKGVKYIKFVEEFSSTIEKGYVISIDPKPGTLISDDYPVTVAISKGAKVSIKVESGYEGKSLDLLKKYIEGKKLILVDSNQRYYSKYNKDTVYYYDIGDYFEGDKIEYILSLGPYTFKASNYNGKSKSDAQALANNEITNKAFKNIKFVDTETDKDELVNKTFDCSISGDTVSCKIGIKNAPQITSSEYNGKTIAEANNLMKAYHDKYNEGSLNYSYGEANDANEGRLYGCSVSGKNAVSCSVYRKSINPNEYNGLTKSEASSKMDSYANAYGVGRIDFLNEISESVAEGKTFGCYLNGNNLNCKVANKAVYKRIMKASSYGPYSSYQYAQNEMYSIFSGFNSIMINEDMDSEFSEGTITSIRVRSGDQASFAEIQESGDYRVDITDIQISISTGARN